MDINRRSQEVSLDHEDIDLVMRKRQQFSNPPNRTSRDSFSEFGPVGVRPDPNDVPIDLVGTLHKKGRLLKSWKHRYFEIQGQNMYYYKNDKSQECLGYIDLSKLYYVGKSTAASFGATFEVQTSGRVHLLAARDERDMIKWISVIKSKMREAAKSRERKGSKADVNAVTAKEIDKRRATVKLNRGGGGRRSVDRQKYLNVVVDEEEEVKEQDVVTGQPSSSVTASQSFPEISSHRVAGIAPSTGKFGTVPSTSNVPATIEYDDVVPSTTSKYENMHNKVPSTSNVSTTIEYDDVVPSTTSEYENTHNKIPSTSNVSTTSEYESMYNDVPSTSNAPATSEYESMYNDVPTTSNASSTSNYDTVYDNVQMSNQPEVPHGLPISSSDNTTTNNLVSPEDIVLPPPPFPSDNNDLLANLPSPDDIGVGMPFSELPAGAGHFDFSEFSLPPLLESSPLPKLKQALPAQGLKQETSEPLKTVSSSSLPGPLSSSSASSIKSTDSDNVQKLRELVEADDTHWKLPYDQTGVTSEDEPWLLEDTAIEQLRHFLRVCP